MQQLKKQIKEKKIEGIYLFYGEEKFIMNAYLDRTADTALSDSDRVMNLDVFDAPNTDIERTMDAMSTLPFMGEKRVVILKELDLFNSKNSAKVEKLLTALDQLPSTTVLIIQESEIDKRGKLYKKVNTLGRCVEFKPLSEDELVQYIADQLNKKGKKIERSVAKYFVNAIGFDLTIIHNELDKLMAFYEHVEIIERQGIDEICTKSVENRIFELVECMGTSRRQIAMKLYHDLLLLKEPPMRILFMITRQFRLILQAKLLVEQKVDHGTMASKLKVPSFVLEKNIRQSHNFSSLQLKQALQECLEAEVAMKTGKMDIALSIELLILKYSSSLEVKI